jgi:uncharacterized protein (TIGR00661 family)
LNKEFSVLIAPLDWGLGHATRCIPIIREFLQRGCKVSVASSGAALSLLKSEFPGIHHHELISYGVRYQSSGSLILKLLLQVPRFLWAIYSESKQIERLVHLQSFDLLISDNRYGCRSKVIRSIFITHQVSLLPRSSWWIRSIANYYQATMIKRFDTCWVPDLPSSFFSGDLSKTEKMPVRYIGILSRFAKSLVPLPVQYKLLVIISGPEPQRQIFEDLIRSQIKGMTDKVLLVKGLPKPNEVMKVNGNVSEVDHLSATEMQAAIQSSEFIVCRSGYSSIMDMAVLERRNLIMVPTPGQPEQEYLADRLRDEHCVYVSSQDQFNLIESMGCALNFKGLSITDNNKYLLASAIDELLNQRVLR